jgi:transglutaminase-like putative cysteine protease
MKRILTITILLICTTAILAAGCTTATAPAPISRGDTLFTQAEQEFRNNNLYAADQLFRLAQENYTLAGDNAAALKARDRAMMAQMMTFEFSSNRSVMDQKIAAVIPSASAQERAGWLDDPMTVTLHSDGETWYHDDTLSGIFWHNMTLMRNANAVMKYTPFYDELVPLVFGPVKNGTGPYGDPVVWVGVEELSVPRELLPANGTLKLWIPLPIESSSQTNVTIISVEPARYVRSMTGTNADLGLAYFEVPLGEIKDPFLNITARFRFVQHSVHFRIDPSKVQPYNTSAPGYVKYTAPGKNIVTPPEMKKKAQEIVGNATNPYLRAQKIYRYIVNTLPYSHAPHLLIETIGTPTSTYVLETGIGDCGAQSQYFAALCRSLGIPARVPVGYQMILGSAGTHVWAEYYLEGYGWIPVDVTVAEGADWSYNATADERYRFREYFFGNLDPYRYVIQQDVDVPLTPDPGDAEIVTTRNTIQIPDAVCDTCTDNPSLMIPGYWTVTFTKG